MNDGNFRYALSTPFRRPAATPTPRPHATPAATPYPPEITIAVTRPASVKIAAIDRSICPEINTTVTPIAIRASRLD